MASHASTKRYTAPDRRQRSFENAYPASVAQATESATVENVMIAELRKYTPMFALVHARSNAPNENVVGSPILEFAQSASVRNAVAAMNRSGKTADTQKSEIATTSGHECRRDLHRLVRGGAVA